MRLVVVVAVAALVISCDSSVASSPKSSGGPASSPSPTAPPISTPTPTADQSPCRIPIAPPGYDLGVGFVSYPNGSYTQDTNTAMPVPPLPGLPDGNFGLTYDRRFAKWLPVPPNWVATDERRYAYGTLYSMNNPNPTNLGLHVVDVATGVEKAVALGDWLVVAFDAAGVYVVRQSATAAGSGLFLIDPDSGSVRQITSAGSWTYVAGDSAWGTNGSPDSLLKLDVRSGQFLSGAGSHAGNGTWFVRPGTTILAVGGDNRGDVIVQSTTSIGLEFWLIGAQTDDALEIYSGSSQGADSLNSVYANGDRHGVWFGTGSGLYLYPYAGSLVKVASNPGLVAGICS